MMTRIMTFLMVVIAGMTIISCEKFEEGIPPKDVRKDFNAMYPDAKDVEWEKEGNCWKVSYEIGVYPNVVEYETLYDSSGNWILTRKD